MTPAPERRKHTAWTEFIRSHPTILAALELADETSFDKASRGPWTIRTYRGTLIYTSESLVGVGTTDGYVYDTLH